MRHIADTPGGPPDVRFSNRPFGVKRFQTIHHCSVDVAHGLALLFGIGTKALPEGETKLLEAYRRRGLKEGSDNVVHKPGGNMLVDKDNLSAAVDLLNKLILALL